MSDNGSTNTSAPTAAIDTEASTPVDDSAVGTLGGAMVTALERAWAAIRARHPELPPVVVVIGAGSGGKTWLKLGHFAAKRWQGTPTLLAADDGELHAAAEPVQDSDPRHEVFIGGEGLSRGPNGVVATLLHEGAHALAFIRGIQDTSRQGRWHNAKFRKLAEEMGLTVTFDPRIGWSPTTLAPAAEQDYGDVIGELGTALTSFRAVDTGTARTKAKKAAPIKCGCNRRIQIGKKALDLGPIFCGLCRTAFEPRDNDAEDQDDQEAGEQGDQDVEGGDAGDDGWGDDASPDLDLDLDGPARRRPA